MNAMDLKATDVVVDLVIRYGFQLLGALIILAVGVMLARWAGRLIERRTAVRSMEPPMRTLIVRCVRIVVLLFAVVIALDKFGFQVAPLVAGIGVAGIGIGIALQGVLGNIVAGLSIIFTKPFRVGEYIELVGVQGQVATIELFSTTLLHPDLSRVIIPNRKIVGEVLHNYGTIRQISLAVSVPLATDLGAALVAAGEVVARNPRVLAEPAPVIGVVEVSERAAVIGARPWVKVPDVGAATVELNRALVEEFRTRRIDLGAVREIRLLDAARAAAVSAPPARP
jgi:small conductance mechanosensitive channel